jgi:hypothetical protein
MPFKGDMRLGGPHDNEATLNGAGEDIPSGNTFLRADRYVYPIAEGGAELSYYYDGVTHYVPTQTAEVDVYSDGLGGEVIDWQSARNVQYRDSGTEIYVNYAESGGNSVETPVGSFTIDSWAGTIYQHDGSGGVQTGYYDYFWAGTATEGAPAFIGNDPTGGSLETEVPYGSTQYYTWATYTDTDYFWDFTGSYYYSVNNGVSVTAVPYDYITSYDYTDYYWTDQGDGSYGTTNIPPE